MTNNRQLLLLLVLMATAVCARVGIAQERSYESYQAVFNLPERERAPFETVDVEIHHVAGSFYYLSGEGGNIGLSIGEDGIIMVDDQFAPLSEKIFASIRTVSDADIRFLINTHVHDDHVGGNLQIAAHGAEILAHENVRTRMMHGIRGNPPSPKLAWPVLTFLEPVTLYLNNEEVQIIPSPPAHTDGDIYVFFIESNVLHLGDVFRTTGYPNIDVGNGGTLAGTIAGLELALELAGPETKIVPGHGVVSSRTEVQELLDVTLEVKARVALLVEQGMSFEEIVAAKPTADLDDRWGSRLDRFLPGVYIDLTQ
ncbi:MAG: MBL fold metallo-hydrolase [Arenicellaceae bacterium]|nr:MBL fold metallo-hydrolase [Arenicellaceae bacterium]